MQASGHDRRGLMKADHYLSVMDLYASRVASSRVVPLEPAGPPLIVFIGRKPRRSLAVLASRDHYAGALGGRRRLASVATAGALALSILAGATLV